MSISSQMEHVLRTLRTVSVQCDLSGPDADLVVEPDMLLCPITRTMFRDPVMVVDSGHTYERSAIESHFRATGQGPAHGSLLEQPRVVMNWMARQIVQAWLDKHPDVTPDGWDSRELLEPSKDDGTRTFDDEGDVGVLRTWRAMCLNCRRWQVRRTSNRGLGRVRWKAAGWCSSTLEGFGLTGAVPADWAAHVAEGVAPHGNR